jgi:hypothetical protein
LRQWIIFGLITVSVLSFSPSLWAGPIIFGGTVGGGNCIPFGCSGFFGATAYQQVYAASKFSSTVPISRITFFAFTTGPQYHLDGTFEISLSYTTRPVNGLSSGDPSDNIGADEALFGSYTLTGEILPAMLSFDGNTFSYDPLLGNLLMTVIISAKSSEPFAFFEADSSGTVTSRAVFPQGADQEGLATGFNLFTPVPEPPAFPLLALAMALTLVGYKLRLQLASAGS